MTKNIDLAMLSLDTIDNLNDLVEQINTKLELNVRVPANKQGTPKANENLVMGAVLALIKVVELKDKKIAELEQRINEIEKKPREMLFSKLFKPSTASAEERNVLVAVSKEQSEIQSKENSIVVFGLKPETTVGDKENKMDEIRPLLSVLGVGDDSIKKVYKMRNRDEKKPAVYRIVTSDETTKFDILKKARQLKSNDKYNKVYINNDLTITQQIQMKELLKERKEKNESLSRDENGKFNGEFYYGIRDFKLVKISIKH